MSSSQRSSEMFEPEDIHSLIMAETGQFVVANGVMIGTTENIEPTDKSISCISLIFIDLDGELHPVLMHPQGELLDYLISDEFRDMVGSLRQKLLDKDAR